MPVQGSGEQISPEALSELLKYRASHRDLLYTGRSFAADPDGDVCGLGAIVIPTCHDLSGELLPGIRLGLELAEALKRPLLLVTSRDARFADLPAEVRALRGTRLFDMDMGAVPAAWRPKLDSSGHKLSRLNRSNDVGSKRNLGLSVAFASRWDTVLFLDDDISARPDPDSLNATSLAHWLQVMAQFPVGAVGWTATDFRDNSVIGHARAELGLDQEVFVGGGAMLLRISADVPFFSDVYNEDWLQTMGLLARPGYTGIVVHAGNVGQLEYDPFTRRRARSEEAGDILAEALMNDLENSVGQSWDFPRGDVFWRQAVRERAKLIRLLRGRATRLPDQDLGGRIVEALTAAEATHQSLRPSDFREYLEVLDRDQARWKCHLSRLGGLERASDRSPSPEVPLKDLAMGAEPSWLSEGTLRKMRGAGALRVPMPVRAPMLARFVDRDPTPPVGLQLVPS